MNAEKVKPQELSVIVRANPQTVLIDRRVSTKGIVFGTVEGVAKQYGIKMQQIEGGLKLTGPKSRLQIFVEKLHFSTVPYRPI